MLHWYKKVSFARLPILITTALLGNLGQIVIANKVINSESLDRFQHLCANASYLIAEVETFNTTSEDISADILFYWGLNPILVNSIRYSFDIASADNNIKPFAIANYVVYNTISSTDPDIDEDKVEEMADFLGELNLKPTHYLKAIEKISSLNIN